MHLYVRRIGACFTLGQRERAEFFARYQLRKPFLLLRVRSKKQQRSDTDRVVRVYENRCRRATAADFLKHPAVGHLRKTASTVFHWRGRSEHADATESIDNLAWNIRLSIYLGGVEMFVEKLAEFRKRLVQLRLLRCRDAWIRHHPVGNEMTLEKTFREAKRLRPPEEEFLRLLNFLLPLRFDFVHKKFAAENGGHAL